MCEIKGGSGTEDAISEICVKLRVMWLTENVTLYRNKWKEYVDNK
jgi:hypothetical protein